MFIHSDLERMMKNFRMDSHPMGIMCSSLAALSTFYPENNPSVKGENLYEDRNVRLQCIFKILGKVPTIAANAYRHRIGRDYNMPHDGYSYVKNFLYMLDCYNE